MRIIHITDIHGDIEAVGKVADFSNQNGIEAIVCTGDFIGQILSMGETTALQQTQAGIWNSVSSDKPLTFKQKKEIIAKDPRAPAQLKDTLKVYEALLEQFDKGADAQYKQVAEVLSRFKGELVTIPGNWDTPKYFDYFGHGNVHETFKKLGRVKFGGYGGAPANPVFNPGERFLGFSGQKLFRTLSEWDPDVALVHAPPFGLQDRVSNGGSFVENVGEFSTRAYIAEQSPNLVLCGHIHQDFGAVKHPETGTIVINSGNLGYYKGDPRKGTFSEIELDGNNYVERLVAYQIQDSKIEKLGETVLSK